MSPLTLDTLGRMSKLRREIGLPGAVLLGLGSMIGTGVFVSLGLAAGVAGNGLLGAIALAGVLAMANALSSAQLAAAHPVSGGTYEYGRRYLTPSLGFAAGWTFLCAKSASAATAALGAAGYLMAIGDDWQRRAVQDDALSQTPRLLDASAPPQEWLVRAIAIAVVVVLTALVAGGIRRSNRTNAVIVSITLASLASLIVFAWPSSGETLGGSVDGVSGVEVVGLGDTDAPGVDARSTTLLGAPSFAALLQATALMFVAFTGYGRLATLGEEVRDPRRVIPRAIVATMIVTMLLYLMVAWVSLRTLGGDELGRITAETAAPLETVAHATGVSWLPAFLAVGAVTAMLGVLLNLILGLSRVVLAMARQGDAPAPLANISAARASPVAAVFVCGAAIAVLASTGSVKLSWSLSAFTVLLYYAITNLAALRLPRDDRRFPRAIALGGLVACLGLACWVEWRAWVIGLTLLTVGFMLRAVLRHLASQTRTA